jgi:hypothetical protein
VKTTVHRPCVVVALQPSLGARFSATFATPPYSTLRCAHLNHASNVKAAGAGLYAAADVGSCAKLENAAAGSGRQWRAAGGRGRGATWQLADGTFEGAGAPVRVKRVDERPCLKVHLRVYISHHHHHHRHRHHRHWRGWTITNITSGLHNRHCACA